LNPRNPSCCSRTELKINTLKNFEPKGILNFQILGQNLIALRYIQLAGTFFQGEDDKLMGRVTKTKEEVVGLLEVCFEYVY
jgi:hypothetical protein